MPIANADHDGITNLGEFQAGTNPLQPPGHAAVPALPDWGLAVMALVLALIATRRSKRRGV